MCIGATNTHACTLQVYKCMPLYLQAYADSDELTHAQAYMKHMCSCTCKHMPAHVTLQANVEKCLYTHVYMTALLHFWWYKYANKQPSITRYNAGE